jgi:hypothetical protein
VAGKNCQALELPKYWNRHRAWSRFLLVTTVDASEASVIGRAPQSACPHFQANAQLQTKHYRNAAFPAGVRRDAVRLQGVERAAEL